MTIRSKRITLMVMTFVLLLSACQPTSSAPPTTNSAASAATSSAAATYCTQNGGMVETRYPFYGTNDSNPLQLAGSLQVCIFTAPDKSQIFVALDTLYTDQPTLAAIAYQAQVPMQPNRSGGNPSSFYCTQLGGTDAFGGVNASGGGWAKADASDVIAFCVFPDLSVIDSWGLTYHSEGTIRGADLTNLLRYQSPQAPKVFP
jgi:putative hemolysin